MTKSNELNEWIGLKKHFFESPTFTEKFICHQCPRVYIVQQSFREHIKYHSKKLKENSSHENLPSEYIGKEDFMCDKCPKLFISKNQIQKHMTRFHMKEEKLLEAKDCKTCEKQFRSPSIYINHYQETHGGLPPEYIDKNLFFCEKCPRAFLSRPQLTDHIYKVHFIKGINSVLSINT